MFPENGGQSIGEILRAALPADLSEVFSPGDDRRRRSSFAKRLGKAISNRRERRYGDDGLHVTPATDDTHRRVKRWRVIRDAGLAGLAGLIPPEGKTNPEIPVEKTPESIYEPAKTNPPNPQTRSPRDGENP
jgi:hypothetical protein